MPVLDAGAVLRRSNGTETGTVADPLVVTGGAGSASIGSVKDDGPAVEGTKAYFASADATSGIDISAAPTSGQKRVLRQAVISVDTAMKVTLQMETTAGDERVAFFLPANGSVIFVPRYPVKLGTADKKWRLVASVAGNVAVSTTTTSEA